MADYEVGYGKPPTSTRFKPGESGNPRGRPKKSVPRRETDAEILRRIGDELIEIKGVRRSRREWELIALQAKACSGHVAAARHLQSIREKAGLDKPKVGGVLRLGQPPNLDEWEAGASKRQEKYRSRGFDPEKELQEVLNEIDKARALRATS